MNSRFFNGGVGPSGAGRCKWADLIGSGGETWTPDLGVMKATLG
jgi:hypothetical protein